MFQSTHLYKVRHVFLLSFFLVGMFQSTHLYKVRPSCPFSSCIAFGFNPRTYIRCDLKRLESILACSRFQSTHLYKVRLNVNPDRIAESVVSIHKVRHFGYY